VVGVGADAERLWTRLYDSALTLFVGGVAVAVPDAPGTALIVATHAAKHGIAEEQPLQDLARAIDRLPPSAWRGAQSLALDLDAEGAFGTGLRLLPPGRALADQLGTSRRQAVTSTLTAEAAPGAAIRLEQLASAEGWRAKAGFLARTLFPQPSYMRLFRPLARRSTGGLVLAYALRPLGLARDALPAWWAWRRARRKASTSG
jgi:hypothetical protein